MEVINRGSIAIRGQALIGLLIALAIIATLIAVMYGGSGQRGGGGVYDNSIERAQATACGVYTEQIRAAIMEYRQGNESNPPNLDALKKYGVTQDMYDSPGCVYSYDPSNGHLYAPNSMRPGQGATIPAAPDGAADTGQPPSGTPTTTVTGPGGMPIRVPTGQ